MDFSHVDEFLSISASWFITLSNAFVFPDPEPTSFIILYGWPGISGEFGVCSFMSSSVIQLKVKVF